MIANMFMNIAFVFPLAHAGLALATSLGAFFNASLLLKRLLKEKVYQPSKGWRLYILRIILACEVMAVLLHKYVDTELWSEWSAMDRVMNLAMWIGIAAAVYFVVLFLSGLKPRHFRSSI
jgi:putative peptidoglycan lipid II flippase